MPEKMASTGLKRASAERSEEKRGVAERKRARRDYAGRERRSRAAEVVKPRFPLHIKIREFVVVINRV